MSQAAAAGLLDSAASPLVGPVSPGLLSLAVLVQWMLQPKRAMALEEAPFETPEFVKYDEELLRFTEEVRDRGDAMFDDIAGPTSLSELLTAVSDWDGAPEIREYLVLSTLRCFAPENEDPRRFCVRKLEGKRLETDDFFGDELIVDLWGDGNEQAAQ
jgi:hypothetical protein